MSETNTRPLTETSMGSKRKSSALGPTSPSPSPPKCAMTRNQSGLEGMSFNAQEEQTSDGTARSSNAAPTSQTGSADYATPRDLLGKPQEDAHNLAPANISQLNSLAPHSLDNAAMFGCVDCSILQVRNVKALDNLIANIRHVEKIVSVLHLVVGPDTKFTLVASQGLCNPPRTPNKSTPLQCKYPHPSLLITEDAEVIQSLLILGCIALGNFWITIHHINLLISSLMYFHIPAASSMNRVQEVALTVQKEFHPVLSAITVKLNSVFTLEGIPVNNCINYILNSIHADLICIKVFDTRDERELELAVWRLYMQPITDSVTYHWENIVGSLCKLIIVGPSWFACSADFMRIISCNLCKFCNHPTFLCQFPERLGIEIAKEDLEEHNELDVIQLLAQVVAGQGQSHGHGSQHPTPNAN
ncbi:hypothetical protein BDQ17DRAFT_1436277 [Cyathus striatus]|nr:hypothetical protein BDQ17DRAFT_1436277 [Cyathus striatus]